MISWLSKWAQGIIVAVIIATLIELILPNGSSKKYVKVVIGVYILFTIISPVIEKLKNDDFGINEILNTQKYEEEFHQPEAFLPLGRRLMVIPVPDESVQNDAEKAVSKPPAEHDR